jgi:putative component of toxin-antitoxin plasmid stabilization module
MRIPCSPGYRLYFIAVGDTVVSCFAAATNLLKAETVAKEMAKEI